MFLKGAFLPILDPRRCVTVPYQGAASPYQGAASLGRTRDRHRPGGTPVERRPRVVRTAVGTVVVVSVHRGWSLTRPVCVC